MTIELLDPDQSPYDASLIATVLEHEQIDNIHGGTFTGRPTTKLVVHPDYVIKLRTEYTFNRISAQRYISKAAQKEKSVGIHHPDKTWFLLTGDDPNAPVIANITPHLLALNRTEELNHKFDNQLILKAFERCFELYLETAARHEVALDLSLSNFGIDAQGNVYYLDDDFYDWDHFTTFSVFLGNLLRAEAWIDTAYAEELGEHIRELVMRCFHDKHWITVIVEELRAQFLPKPLHEKRTAMLRGLYSGGKPKQRVVETASASVIALLADVHANAPALEATLDYLAKRGINSLLIMGDIVGYGPHPGQCIDMLRSLPQAAIVMGNHDHATATGQYARGFSNQARWVIEWTTQKLNQEQIEWLDQLPPYLQGDSWLALHGAPRDKTFFNAYVYQMTYEDNLEELERRGIRYCFHGHTHLPKVYYKIKNITGEQTDPQIQLTTYDHALICPGSVGQPRSGETGAELAIIDFDSQALEFHRLPYPMDSVLADMESEHFPPNLVDRLRWGK